MLTFVDTYVCCDDENDILTFCSSFEHYIIGPKSGISAVDELTEENGTIIQPAQDQIGDPNLFYACIRSEKELTLPENISLCDDELGKKIVGIWF